MTELSILEQQMMVKGMTEQQKMLFRNQYDSVKKDPGTILFLSVLFGGLGVDRFMLNDMGMGLLKMFSSSIGAFILFVNIFTNNDYLRYFAFALTFGLWFVDIFFIRRRVNEYNKKEATEIIYNIKILSGEDVTGAI